MPRIKNTLVYPFKPNPKLTDWLVGSDSEDFGETLSFRVGDISGTILGGGLPDGIISGTFSPVKGTMTLNLSRIVYRIGGRIYTTEATTITLDDGGVDPRIDVIAVNIDQEVVLIKGDEADPAVKPILPDTSTHLEFTQLNIGPGDTEPGDIEVNLIFDEEDPSEYAASNNTSDTSIEVVSNLPFSGSKAIKIESPTPGNKLTLTPPQPVQIESRNFLQFQAYLILNLIYPKGLKISFYNGGNKVSSDVTVRDGLYGMDGDLMTTYQLVTVPFTEFVFTDTHYDSIVIQPTDHFGVGIMYLDYITISSGFSGIDTSINHSEIYLDDGTNPHGTTQEDVGLGNVNNTSDIDKPISIAQQVEFDDRYTKSEINNFFGGVTSITGYNKSYWDSAYSWGDHSLEGYLTNQDLQFDVVTPIDSYFGTKYKPLGVASSGIYIDGSSNKSNGVLINVPNNVGIDTYGAFSLVQDNIGYETGGDFILYPNNYRYAQYRNNLGVYFTSKLFITGSRNTSEITFELGNVAQAYNNPSNLDTILKMASNREITAPQLTNARITSGGDFSLVTKKYLEDNSSTFTPTDLLTDYGFTDNSTNWNTAFGWGNHAVAGYELQSNKGVANGYASLDSNSKLLTSQLPDLAVTSVITVTETNLADFAANSSSYSFEEGDVIVITDAGETEHYMYKGGTKTDVNEYSLINNTEIDWGQVTNTPTTLAGYGITDAYTQTYLDQVANNLIGDDVASVSVTGDTTKTVSITLNNTTVLSDTFTDNDNYVDNLSFNTGNGIITLGRTGSLSDLTINLDGRYSLLSHASDHLDGGSDEIAAEGLKLTGITHTNYTTSGSTLQDHLEGIDIVLGNKEDSFSKNTGFNKDFGTMAGTVSEGNHAHTFAQITSKPTTISGYGITDFNSLGDVRWLRKDVADTASGVITFSAIPRLQNNGSFPGINFNNGTSNRFLFRSGDSLLFQYNGTDNGTIWHSLNDGSGSGLDADLLDGIDSTQFLRSDVADTKTSGELKFNDNVTIGLGTSARSTIFSDGSSSYLNLLGGNFYIQDVGTNRFTFERSTGDFIATGDLIMSSNASYLRADISSGASTRIHGINASNNEYIGSVDQTTSQTFLGINTGTIDFGKGRAVLDGSGNFTATGSINSTKAFINGGTGANLNIASNPNGTIELGNGSAGTLPAIAGKSNNNAGLFLIGATNDSNTNGDLIFNVRENDNTDFTTFTNKAFVWSRFGTELANLTRNGNFTNVGTIVSQGTGDSSFAGNLGIGSNSASLYRLEVENISSGLGVKIQSSSSGYANLDLVSDRTSGNIGGIRYQKTGDAFTSSEINHVIDGGIVINTGNGDSVVQQRFRVSEAGNVSIGNNNDTYKLDVSGTGRFTNILTIQSADQAVNRLRLDNTGGTGYWDIIGGIHNTSQSGLSIFSEALNNRTFSIFDSGNIHIGTNNTDFGFGLDVQKTSRFNDDLKLAKTVSSSAAHALLDVQPYSTNGNTNILISNGNLLGSPTSSSADPFMFFNRWTGTGSNTNAFSIGVDGPSGGLSIFSGGNTSNIGSHSWVNRFVINKSGNVSIGNVNNTYKLDVSGPGRFTGDVTATNFVLSSDRSLKTNIKDISSEEYVNVNWKTFELKENRGQKRYGVIAQELEETNPEFVRTNEEGVKSVAYIDLLIVKIAELEARLEKAGL